MGCDIIETAIIKVEELNKEFDIIREKFSEFYFGSTCSPFIIINVSKIIFLSYAKGRENDIEYRNNEAILRVGEISKAHIYLHTPHKLNII